jgi:hypothetical protein
MSAYDFFKGRLERDPRGRGGIWASGSNPPPARSGCKCLRHTIGGGVQ